MKKKCIFRCQANGRRYRVMAVPNVKASRGEMYYAYVGRHRLEKYAWFNPEFAIESVMKDALGYELWKYVREAV